MSRETLGYVKLEWTCPKCGSRNPGPEKTCLSCGAPQPEDVQFVQASAQELSQDESLRKMAEKGPDVHCPFCGTRNPADAPVCSQCGGDLKQGLKRETGRVIGAYTSAPAKEIPCPNCSAMNPETDRMCAQCGAPLRKEAELQKPAPAAAGVGQQRSGMLVFGLVAVGILLVVCIVAGLIYASSPRETEIGTVQSVGWQTRVAIEALNPVTRQDWQDQIPQDAQIEECVDRVYTTVIDEPGSGNYNKVCGTPYTLDTGSGVGQVVQDCEYEILEPYCEYSSLEWQVVDEAELSGSDMSPLFANPPLAENQRLGDQRADYVIIFSTGEGQYTYRPAGIEEFRRYVVGSEWSLLINSFGQIVAVEQPQ